MYIGLCKAHFQVMQKFMLQFPLCICWATCHHLLHCQGLKFTSLCFPQKGHIFTKLDGCPTYVHVCPLIHVFAVILPPINFTLGACIAEELSRSMEHLLAVCYGEATPPLNCYTTRYNTEEDWRCDIVAKSCLLVELKHFQHCNCCIKYIVILEIAWSQTVGSSDSRQLFILHCMASPCCSRLTQAQGTFSVVL